MSHKSLAKENLSSHLHSDEGVPCHMEITAGRATSSVWSANEVKHVMFSCLPPGDHPRSQWTCWRTSRNLPPWERGLVCKSGAHALARRTQVRHEKMMRRLWSISRHQSSFAFSYYINCYSSLFWKLCARLCGEMYRFSIQFYVFLCWSNSRLFNKLTSR